MYKYTENDFDKISWDRIDDLLDKIAKDIENYLKVNSLRIKYIVPIMRGGGIPAIILSHKLNVIDVLPIQVKYNYKTRKIDRKIDFAIYQNIFLEDNECILLVEGNHASGKSAQIAKDMILDKLGKSTKIIYCAITQDYSSKESVGNTIFATRGMFTNELKNLSKNESKSLNINYQKVSLYPWEDVEEELFGLNNNIDD